MDNSQSDGTLFRNWPGTYSEAVGHPLAGAENAVPWRFPLPPGSVARTFWGRGYATTGEFNHDGDAALRIVSDSGPLKIRFQRDDAKIRDNMLPIPEGGGQALDAFQDQEGTYRLLIEAPGRWGVTVVSRATEPRAQSTDRSHRVVGGAPPVVSFEPRMPEVEPLTDPNWLFTCARRLAVKLKQFTPGDLPNCADFQVMLPQENWFWGGRALVIVTPGKDLLCFPVSPHDSAVFESILPRNPPRNIAVISYTALTPLTANPDHCIPFRGFLMQFAALGHTVWVFEGHPSRLEAGFRDADILLIDGGMIPHLPPNWQDIAGGVMRGQELWIHDRERYVLVQTKVGKVRVMAGGGLLKFDEPPTVLGGVS